MKKTAPILAFLIVAVAFSSPTILAGGGDTDPGEVSGKGVAKLFFEKERPVAQRVHDPAGLRIRVLLGREDWQGKLVWKPVNPRRASFRPGDRFKFEVTSLKDGYLNMYNVDLNGQRNLLLPHKEISGGNNLLKAKKPYVIPPKSAEGYYRVMGKEQMTKKKGKEVVDFYLVSREVLRGKRKPSAAKMVFVRDPEDKDDVIGDGLYVGAYDDFLHYRLELKIRR